MPPQCNWKYLTDQFWIYMETFCHILTSICPIMMGIDLIPTVTDLPTQIGTVIRIF